MACVTGIVKEDTQETVLPRHLSPGRIYYSSLIEQKQKRHWSMQFTLYSSFASKGFDDNSQRVPLACALFGRNIRLRDIYLLSRLSDDNKVRIDNHDPRVEERPATAREGFGSFKSDQYLALLAPAVLDTHAESREFGVHINTAYRFTLGKKERVSGVAGLIVPIKTRLHIVDVNIMEGSLFTQAFVAFGVVRTTPLTQFSSDFTGLLDFFQRGILAPKGLELDSRQRKTGFGDMTLFGLLDFAEFFEKLDCLQVGMNIVLPTGKSGNKNVIFPVSLGNGSVQLDFFANVLFATRARMFNPAFHLVGNIMPGYRTVQRMPKRIVNTARMQMETVTQQEVNINTSLQAPSPSSIPGVLVTGVDSTTTLARELRPPQSYDSYYVDSFDELDSLVPAFANTAFPVILNRANRILVGFGNYSYDIFNTGLQLSIFYTIMHKAGDCFKIDKSTCKKGAMPVENGQLDFDSASKVTSEKSHSLSWALRYKFKSLVELNIGSQHVIVGKNVPSTHEVFASLIAVF